jgi:hypothetical protein
VESNTRLVWELNSDSLRFAIGALGWLWFRAVKRYDTMQDKMARMEGRIALLEAAHALDVRQNPE